ncbi:calcium-activated chloride channel regulator 1-like [Pseudophryne corroboree]|uniref:calcium-activated chloride channel regulator 1-like n=1 Tax=Pseudophryne corroboree TaxID=495146 RepID=UPI0030815FC1
MELWLVAIIFTVLIYSPSETSFVKLNKGGYEDIVIAIHPGVPENVKIIDKIKEMVNEATHYLFNATQKRLFIKTAKILIPLTWSNKNYTKRRTESYDKADVIVADPYLKYGEDPYTLQYGGCGEPARYIHFTPNFLLDDKLISVYGPRGRVFVHEWAHLRWGVFDEYNFERPYYLSTDLKVEATRCSHDILGVNVKSQCQGDSCTVRACYFDSSTGLYEEDCIFVPIDNQFVKHSIMYLQALPSVSEFCNSSNHNIEAPTLQNRMCNYRSTWDVIMNSTDINSSSPMESHSIPVPSISLIQYRDRVVTLVLDVSGSMAGIRIQKLYRAAEIFVMQIIEAGSYVGIVTFSTAATVTSPLLQIRGDVERNKLKSFLPKSAAGGTNICTGILAGIEVNKQFDKSSFGTDIILLSDGEDNYDPRDCFSAIENSGVIISFISLGPDWARPLTTIIQNTGGQQYSASDDLNANDLIGVFTGILPENGDISKQAIQLESTSTILTAKECLNDTVYIDNTVGNDTFFVVTWQTEVPIIKLQDPNGKVYTHIDFTTDTTTKSSRLAIPGRAEVGRWYYSLCNTRSSNQGVGLIVNSKAADEKVPPITVTAHMNTIANDYPNPMVVYATVSQGLLPVKGANVTATIEPLTGTPVVLQLLDNGAGADIVKNDGVYSKYFTAFKFNGRYSLQVRAEGVKGKSRLALRNSRALYIPGYIQNGTVTMNPPRSTVDDELNLGEFSRMASGGAFDVSNIPTVIPLDIYKPDKITDLAARIESGSVILSWTATGDDMDEGSASRYDLRMSVSPKDLRDNFNGSTPVNMSSVTPQPAGSSETFTFAPENVVIENGTILFFAIVAIDKVSQISDMSNIAQAALFIPPTPAPTTVHTSTTPAPTTVHTSTTPAPTTVHTSTTPAPTTVHTSTTPAPTTVHTTSGSSDNVKVSVVTAILCAATVLISNKM